MSEKRLGDLDEDMDVLFSIMAKHSIKEVRIKKDGNFYWNINYPFWKSLRSGGKS